MSHALLSTAGLRLDPHSAADFRTVRVLLGRAFHDYPLMQHVAPDGARRLRGTTSLYGAILSDTLRHGEVVATPDRAAVACWLPPGTDMPGLGRHARAGMLAVPIRFGWTGFRCLMRYDQLALELHHRYAPEPHWYLAALGVEPTRQRQGLGSQLLGPALARADREGRSCYLDTHRESNVRLYQRHGFRVMWQGAPAGDPVTIWSMRRDVGG